MITQTKLSVPHGTCLCTFYNNGKADVMIIDSVEVEEDYRGQGIGTSLIIKAIDLAQQSSVDSVELIVNSDNIAAKKIYRKTGFERTNKEHYRIIL